MKGKLAPSPVKEIVAVPGSPYWPLSSPCQAVRGKDPGPPGPGQTGQGDSCVAAKTDWSSFVPARLPSAQDVGQRTQLEEFSLGTLGSLEKAVPSHFLEISKKREGVQYLE